MSMKGIGIHTEAAPPTYSLVFAQQAQCEDRIEET